MAVNTTPTAPVVKRSVLDTLKDLFRSRRVLILFGSVLITLLVYMFPELKPMQENLGSLYVIVISVIGAFTLEDGIRLWHEGKNLNQADLGTNIEELVTTVVGSLLEEAFPKVETPAPVVTNIITGNTGSGDAAAPATVTTPATTVVTTTTQPADTSVPTSL